MNEMPKAVFGALIGTAVGAAVLLDPGGLLEGSEARSWPRAQARVSSMSESATFKRVARKHGGSNHPAMRFDIRYDYRIDGTDYTGSTYGPLPLVIVNTSEDDLADARSRFAAGRVIDIHYNPELPSESMIQPSSDTYVWLVRAGAGAAMTLPWLYVVAVARRRR